MHTLRLGLKTNRYLDRIIDKRYGMIFRIHNALVKYGKKQLSRLKKDPEYRELLARYGQIKKEEADGQKPEDKDKVKDRLNEIIQSYGLTKAVLYKYVSVMQKKFKKHISSQQAQAEAEKVLKGIEAVLYGDGKDIHYKKYLDILTITGKSNTNGAKFFLVPDHEHQKLKCYIEWNGLTIPVKLDISKADLPDGKNYVWESLNAGQLKYCEIVRLWFKSGWRYYVNLYLKGDSPEKLTPGKSVMGIDEGTSTLAAVSETAVILEELAPDCKKYNHEILRLQRQVDASVRKTNPDRFREDGTAKKKSECKGATPWKFTNACKQKKARIRELYRKKAEYSATCHHTLVNRMVKDSSMFINEPMDFKALAKRVKAASRQEKLSEVKQKDGSVKLLYKYKRRKRFGKSVNDRSPAELIVFLKQKINRYRLLYYETDPWKYRASQYDHAADTYQKASLSCRFKQIGGHSVQRDLYSAFLQSCMGTIEKPDRELCQERFEAFLKLHDRQIKYMKEQWMSRPACFGF